jgi:hypothetical protein
VQLRAAALHHDDSDACGVVDAVHDGRCVRRLRAAAEVGGIDSVDTAVSAGCVPQRRVAVTHGVHIAQLHARLLRCMWHGRSRDAAAFGTFVFVSGRSVGQER